MNAPDVYNDNRSYASYNSSNFDPQIRGLSTYNQAGLDRSLIPTTVKKILTEASPEPDEAFRIDGVQVHQVSIICKLLSIDPQSTHTLFLVDDQNAKIKCKLWASSNEDVLQIGGSRLKIGDLVKIIGKIDCFQSSRSINIHHIEKITDFNKVTYHHLEAVFAHQLNTILVNQHIPEFEQQFEEFMAFAERQDKSQQQMDTMYQQRQSQYSPQSQRSQQRQYQSSPPQRNRYSGGMHSHSHSDNRLSYQQQSNHNNWNNHNHNYNSNSNNRGNRFASSSSTSYRQPQNMEQGAYQQRAAERKEQEDQLNPFQKKILQWMRTNKSREKGYGDQVQGHEVGVIMQGVGCSNQAQFGTAMQKLYEAGMIFDGEPEGHWCIAE